MQFNSFSDFINMGGYAFYVWLSFGISAILLVALIIISHRQQKNLIKHIDKQQKRQERLQHAAQIRAKKANTDNDNPEVNNESTS